MKLTVSNIAWTNEEEPEVAAALQGLGVKYVEIAPTKMWESPADATPQAIADYKKFWREYGIEIVAFQSMLFNRPDLTLFDSASVRQQTENYLQDYIKFAHDFGAEVLVFGSPKNRQRKDMSETAALKIATEFFDNLGDVAQVNDVTFCIEPNAPEYNCDFITTAEEGIELVRSVNNKGFGLHLDLACMVRAGDDVEASVTKAGDMIKHFHISSPMLGLIEDRDDIPHREAAKTLQAINYKNFISMEMRPGDSGTNVKRVTEAVTFVQSVYK